MKNRLIFGALLLCAAVILVTVPALAQHQRIGASAAPELLIPVGGRDFALGGSSIATSKGIEAIYWNPAGLGRMTGSAEAMFSSMQWIADIDVVFGAVGARFGAFGNIGFAVKSLGFGDIPLTTEDDPENYSQRFYSPTFFTISAAYSRALTDAITVGVGIKLISEKIDRVSASGFAFDFGVQYEGLVGVKGMSLGVAVKNVGPQMRFDGPGLYRTAIAPGGSRPQQFYSLQAASFELPAVVEIGLAYDYKVADNLNFVVNGAFSNNNLYYDEYRGGLELTYAMEGVRLYGRGGYASVPQDTEHNLFGATFGAGISYTLGGIDVTVDYGYRQVDFFDANQVVSLKFAF